MYKVKASGKYGGQGIVYLMVDNCGSLGRGWKVAIFICTASVAAPSPSRTIYSRCGTVPAQACAMANVTSSEMSTEHDRRGLAMVHPCLKWSVGGWALARGIHLHGNWVLSSCAEAMLHLGLKWSVGGGAPGSGIHLHEHWV